MTEALPVEVSVTQAFAARMPTQRVIDAVERAEGGSFGELVQHQPFRIVAFRALLRDFPDYDLTALWLHSYDVEVAVVEVDPTPNGSPRAGPPSATIGAAGPTT